MPDDSMGPQLFLRELSGMRDRWLIDLKETSVELRKNLQEVASELRGVNNALLTLQAQDLGTQLAKLRDVEVAAQAKKIGDLEREVLKAHTTIKVLAAIGSLALTAITVWVAWKH